MTKWVYVGVIVLCNTLGDLMNTIGMRHYGVVRDFHPSAFRRLVATLVHNRFILGGIAMNAISFVTLISLLSVANVSFAIPATAGSFVIEAAVAKSVLKEDVRWQRWVGAALIALGVGLLILP